MQDAAVLCSAYSDLPIFRYAPFDTQTFKAFSVTSTQIIKNVESDACENLKNLPEQYAMSIQGFMKTALLKQELHQTLLEESHSGLWDDIGQMKDVMNAILILQGKGTSRGVKRKAMEDLSALISCVFKNNISLKSHLLSLNQFLMKLIQLVHLHYQMDLELPFPHICQQTHSRKILPQILHLILALWTP